MLYNYIGVASVSSAKFMVSIPVNVGGTLSYNGSVQSPTWDYDTEVVDLISGGNGTNAGTYQAVFRFKDPDKHMWADKSTGDKAIDWKIERTVVTTSVPSQSGTLTYNGSVLSPNWTSYDTTQLQISGQITGTDAGTYESTFTPTDNYKWSDGTLTPVKKSWSIGYAKISYVPSQSETLTYTGSNISPQWRNYDDTQLTMGGVTNGVNAGSYVANFTPTANYTWSDNTKTTKDVTWNISRAVVSLEPSQSGSLVYTGSVLTPTWENYDSVKLTIGGATEGTNAGSYTATFTPTSNYQWSNNTTTSQNVSWAIQKASSNVLVSSSTINLTAEKLFEEITVSWHGTGPMTAISSDTSVAVVEVNGNIVKVSGLKSGSATVTISVNGDDNHTASSKTIAVESSVPQMYKVTADIVPANTGTVTGTGVYAENSNCTLTANPAEDYRFLEWTHTKGRLPNGYTELEYISMSSTGYCYFQNITTDAASVRVVMDIIPQETNTSSSNAKYFFLTDGGGSIVLMLQRSSTAKQISLINAGTTNNKTYTITQGQRINFDCDIPNKKMILGTSSFPITTYAYGEGYIKNSAFGLGRGYANSAFQSVAMDIYSVKIYTSGELVADIVPCISPDGVVGAFNLVDNSFCSSSSGLTAGSNDTEHTEIAKVTANPYTFPVIADTHFTANFTAIVYYFVTINLASGGEGTFTGAGKYVEGDRVTLTATPATDYRFAGWKDVLTGNIVSTDAEYSFVISSNVEFEAVFKSTLIPSYTINAIVSPSNAGTVSGAGIYNEGDEVTLTATANEYFNLTDWTSEEGDVLGESAQLKFTATKDQTITVNFYEYPVAGIDWIASTLPYASYWQNVCFGDNMFVAIGGNKTSSGTCSAYSLDGISWTRATTGLSGSAYWRGLAYGNGKFVSVGSTGATNSRMIAYSEDGMNWQYSPTRVGGLWCSVVYGNDMFVAISGNGYNANATTYSYDGLSWEKGGYLPSSSNWKSIAYGSGKFIATTVSTTTAAYSEDGINWKSLTLPCKASNVSYLNGKFFVHGGGGTNVAAYSEDGGNTWKTFYFPSSAYWYSMSYGSGKYVAIPGGNQYNIVAYSEDGIVWNQVTLPSTANWTTLTYGNGMFVSVGYNSNKALYSGHP